MEALLSEKGGITSTSANHLANIAKELITKYEAQLLEISFLNKEVSLISENKSKLLKKGRTDVSDLTETIEKIGSLKSFCAWVREAIKKKEEMLQALSCLTLEAYLKSIGQEIMTPPISPLPVDKDTIINEMSRAERQEYLSDEAHAATIGKYIHPDGSLSLARRELLQCQYTPSKVEGQGRDLIIYNYSPSLDPEEVEKIFMSLQETHRVYEKSLNAKKAKIQEEVNSRNLLQQSEYRTAWASYKDWQARVISEMNSFVIREKDKISNLKIAIPSSLKDTYEYLQSLGE